MAANTLLNRYVSASTFEGNAHRVVGRAALTNYLFQSVAMNVVFAAVLRGRYDKLSRLEVLIWFSGGFVMQIVIRSIWLRFFPKVQSNGCSRISLANTHVPSTVIARVELGGPKAMNKNVQLPPGQKPIERFPRFGSSLFANRFPADPDRINIRVSGLVQNEIELSEHFDRLDRVEQISDFHCVTTWSKCGLRWSGYRFCDVFEQIIEPLAKPSDDTGFIAFKSQDGYRTILALEYLLADDVLLADRLDGQPLSIDHGAPIRLVAPQHYGYMSPKHLKAIVCSTDDSQFKSPVFKFMSHPIARVALEERSQSGPGWMFRYLYRPLVKPTIRLFERASRG